MSTKTNALPHWDLSNVYPGLESDAFAQDVAELKAQLDALDGYLDANQITSGAAPASDVDVLSGVVNGYLDRVNAAQGLHTTLHMYVYCFVATDSYNATAKRLFSQMDMLRSRLLQAGVRFKGWLGRIAPLLPQILERGGAAFRHAFYLQELVQQSQYLMSEAQETLSTELALSGANAWENLQGTICSQLTTPLERDGKTEQLPMSVIQTLYSDPDPQLRQRVYEADLAGWESVREPLAACMNGVKGATVIIDRRRGREDALHAAIDESRIDRATIETMMGAMRQNFPVFRKYLRAKAARLGRQALPWWDLYAPLSQSERRYSYAEARDFILEHFGGFSERLANYARRAFDHNWIDAEPRRGKVGGAFCDELPTVGESRILCNFDGSLSQVLTLAHELGHGYHSECMVGKTELQKTLPMTLAETASIFCETITTDAMLAQTSSAAEELAILETFLSDSTQTIVDISSRYLFEKEVFERRAQSELSADDFCDIMTRAQKATYGDGMDERYLHPYMWAWKPHYYSMEYPFYNYPYAFGLLFGLGLYAVYQERGAAFVPEYDALLASTGAGTAADLAARFGIDIRQPAFWQQGLKVVEARLGRYLEL